MPTQCIYVFVRFSEQKQRLFPYIRCASADHCVVNCQQAVYTYLANRCFFNEIHQQRLKFNVLRVQVIETLWTRLILILLRQILVSNSLRAILCLF